MSSKPLVSAIIIFLNGEQFIVDAIASIFAQTYDHWELLLVDDGSTDKSTAIAQGYAQKYPEKVRYLEHENHQNRGMSASRNLGIKHAKGNYIGFLDADDIWLPQKLEQQVAILNSYPEAAMVYGRTQIWYSWNRNVKDSQIDHFYDLGVEPNTLVEPPNLLLQLLENKCQTPTTCNALVRREVFQEIGQFEEAFRTMYEDQAFFSKVLLQAPVFVANECWAKYRQHPESCSSQSETQQYYATRRPFLNWLGNYLSEQNVQNRQVWKALQWEKWQCDRPLLAYLLNRIQYRLSQIRSILQRNWRFAHFI
ncbi:MAG TPA: glycosyl transferase family 2 [Cyanobacteria bacterium UBA11369]|nr:glycosyl transferase family 2 [Cyanobacteria bacterium UBA11371]HBE17234.1 glycosyl transferase family 2 [Cyanobacteria bacterium UBA11367]HBE32972.1 glycosyl transferase family 2 [Cyanobacteria bacterium UBA11368]HBE53517.1 glycosyl transferase family 2 [Cyanobacteria bacterium UBA11369]